MNSLEVNMKQEQPGSEERSEGSPGTRVYELSCTNFVTFCQLSINVFCSLPRHLLFEIDGSVMSECGTGNSIIIL